MHDKLMTSSLKDYQGAFVVLFYLLKQIER